MLNKTASVIYSTGAYFLFLGVFVYLAAFELNVVPHSVSGPASLPPIAAALVDFALISLFGLQHSIMARPAFKRWWTRFVPHHLERSTFVWISDALVIVIVKFWQPIEGELWNVTGAAMVTLYAISVLGWLTIPAVSFMTDHFELFGVRQAFEYAFGLPKSETQFKERWMYKHVRHPMMLGFLVAFWAAPHMTIGHFVFAGLMTAYILIGIHFEERSLVGEHGWAYAEYQSRVSMLLPGRRASQPEQEAYRTKAARN